MALHKIDKKIVGYKVLSKEAKEAQESVKPEAVVSL